MKYIALFNIRFFKPREQYILAQREINNGTALMQELLRDHSAGTRNSIQKLYRMVFCVLVQPTYNR